MRTATSSTEESRIKAAYEKRDRSIPENFYSFLRPANLLPSQELERRLALLLAEDQGRQLSCMRILEVGCGCGTWLQQFLRLGARPNCRLALIKTTLAPPIGRRIPGSSPLMYCLLASIPFLRSHYFGRIVPTSC